MFEQECRIKHIFHASIFTLPWRIGMDFFCKYFFFSGYLQLQRLESGEV